MIKVRLGRMIGWTSSLFPIFQSILILSSPHPPHYFFAIPSTPPKLQMCPFLDIVEIFSASSRFLNLNSLIIYIVFISNFVSLATFLLVFIFAPSHYQIPLYFLYFIFYQFSFFSPWQTFHWCDYIFSPPPILLLYFIFYSFSVFFSPR